MKLFRRHHDLRVGPDPFDFALGRPSPFVLVLLWDGLAFLGASKAPAIS